MEMFDWMMFGSVTQGEFVLWLVLSVLAVAQFALLLYAIHLSLKERARSLKTIEKQKQSQDQCGGFHLHNGQTKTLKTDMPPQ